VMKTSGLLIVNENNPVETIKSYPITDFKYRGKTHTFITPLQIDVRFEEGENIFSDDVLGLLVVGKTFEECNKRLEEQLGLLWKEYVEPDETNFSASAKSLRKKIISMVT
jgi:predicted RNase H-like HicB family nuclease